MAYSSFTLAPSAYAFNALPEPAKTRSLWRIVRDALVESRQRQADREIARMLGGFGGKLTDTAEREIERRLMSSSNSTRW